MNLSLGAIAVGTALLVGIAGCSSSQPAAKAPTSSTPTSSTPASTTSSTPSASPKLSVDRPANVLEIVEHHLSYSISGTPRPGLVTIKVDNDDTALHETTLSLLKPGVTLAQVKRALASKDPEGASAKLVQNPDVELSAPVALGAKRTDAVTLRLAAGHYTVSSFLPATGGGFQALEGMVGEFAVAGSPSSVAPKTDGAVELTDTGITVPAKFSAGGTFAVHNAGKAPHDFALLADGTLSPLAFTECYLKTFSAGKPIDGCSGSIDGGVSMVSPGATAYLDVTFRPGKYSYFSTAGKTPVADINAGLVGTFTAG